MRDDPAVSLLVVCGGSLISLPRALSIHSFTHSVIRSFVRSFISWIYLQRKRFQHISLTLGEQAGSQQ